VKAILLQGFIIPFDEPSGSVDKPKWVVLILDDEGKIIKAETFSDYFLAVESAKSAV
jgi:hypothetical protein